MADPKTVYWVTMTCDYMHSEWNDDGIEETPRKKLVIVEAKADAKKRAVDMESKIEVLRKYDMPEEDMAKILGLEVSAIQKKVGAEAHHGDERVIHWEHAIDFLISEV